MKMEVILYRLVIIFMENRLRNVMNNPFLRETPFRAQQAFYSAPKTYSSQSYHPRQKESQNYSYLSVTPSGQNKTLSTTTATGASKLKKSSNPFFRKNLLSKDIDGDYENIEIHQPKLAIETREKKLDRPQFLKSEDCDGVHLIEDLYRDLSHKAPASGSKNYISLDAKMNSCQKLTYDKENAARTGAMSPRFPSVKVLQNFKPVLALNMNRSSLNSASMIPNQNTKRSQPHSRRNSVNFCSHKELSSDRNYERQPQRDMDKQKASINDGRPREITIKAHKYYRQLIHPIL